MHFFAVLFDDDDDDQGYFFFFINQNHLRVKDRKRGAMRVGEPL